MKKSAMKGRIIIEKIRYRYIICIIKYNLFIYNLIISFHLNPIFWFVFFRIFYEYAYNSRDCVKLPGPTGLISIKLYFFIFKLINQLKINKMSQFEPNGVKSFSLKVPHMYYAISSELWFSILLASIWA